jgi:methylmalonyl-CoA mutase cobalamin-binding subunit
MKEYLRSLVPEKIADGNRFVREGFELGNSIPAGSNRFLRKYGLESEVDLRLKRSAEGKMTWRAIMGLSSLEEQKKALGYLYEFGQRTGTVIDVVMHIPNLITALPDSARVNVLKGTSFILEGESDWETLAEAAPIQPAFCDFHIGSPNAVSNTANAIRAGSSYSGVFSQFFWDFPGCGDDVDNLAETLKAIGMIASKKDQKFVVDTYLDDGIPSYFSDMISYLGYAKLEKYIITTLCGARYACSFGQLSDRIVEKLALLLALSDVLQEEDQPGVSYFYSNCIDHWDHDLEANYGIVCTEALAAVVTEKKYKTGVSILPIPITEKVAVPTAEAIAKIHAAVQRAGEKADEWLNLMDFKKVEEVRDKLIKYGSLFYNNILKGFEDAGIDIKNPLEMLVVLKRINPIKLEKYFHPLTADGTRETLIPAVPSSLYKICDQIITTTVISLSKHSEIKRISGKRILVVSADAHSYGSFAVSGVLKAIGAEVIDGGVSVSPAELLDSAGKSSVNLIAISIHNGQALDYARQLMNPADKQSNYRFFMGGKINGILPGDKEPSDVSKLIEEIGIKCYDGIEELVLALASAADR